MRPQTFIVNQTLIIVHEHYALFMYFETLANIEIACSEIFLLSNGFSGAHDFCSNNSDVFHITSLHKTLR